MNNILELDKEELEFVKSRYVNIDIEDLLKHISETKELTYLDNLETMINEDIEKLRIVAFDYAEYKLMMSQLKQRDDWEERQYTWKMLFRVKNKIIHYRKYGSRNMDPNLPKEFMIEDYCKQADDLARKCIGVGIGNTYTEKCIERIDKTIAYLRSLGRHLDHESCWNCAVLLGTKLGELMLEDKLRVRGYEWHMDEHFDVPVIKNPDQNTAANPIGKIMKILESEYDDEGTCKNFYDIFLFMIKKENMKLMKGHSCFDIVKLAIDEWDPLNLLAMGFPDDEYDGESSVISNEIDYYSSVDEIADAISIYMGESFGEEFARNECLKPAQRIYDIFQKIHLVGK